MQIRSFIDHSSLHLIHKICFLKRYIDDDNNNSLNDDEMIKNIILPFCSAVIVNKKKNAFR